MKMQLKFCLPSEVFEHRLLATAGTQVQGAGAEARGMIGRFDQSSLLEGLSCGIRSLRMDDPKFLEVCSQRSWQ